jgi:hypothetical protein
MAIPLIWLLLAMGQDNASKQARTFIEKLRSDSVEDRDEAETRLKELGPAAVQELEKATKDKDPEVAARADALLFAILKRIPSLQEPTTAPLPAGGPFGIATSSTGRFVVLSEPTTLNIFDATTLKPVQSIRVTATSFGFDEKDAVLVVLGSDLRRIETATWKESFRAELPGADCGKMGQGLVTERGKSFYLTKVGGLSIATVEGEKLKIEPQDAKFDEMGGQIERIFGVSGEGLLVAGRSGFGMLWLRGKVYRIASCKNVVAASNLLGRPVYVCKSHMNFLTERYRMAATVPPLEPGIEPPGEGNIAVAFDQRKGIVFAFREKALRARSVHTPEFEQTYTDLPVNTSGLAVDSERRILYAIADGKLLRWRLRD